MKPYRRHSGVGGGPTFISPNTPWPTPISDAIMRAVVSSHTLCRQDVILGQKDFKEMLI